MPRQPKHKKLSEILNHTTSIKKSPVLRSLFARANLTDQLSERFNDALPPLFRDKLTVASLTDGELLVMCPTASLATRFRMEQDKVLKALQMRIGESAVTTIRLQIRPGARLPDKQNQETREQKLKRKERGNQSADERLEGALERLNHRSSAKE